MRNSTNLFYVQFFELEEAYWRPGHHQARALISIQSVIPVENEQFPTDVVGLLYLHPSIIFTHNQI